MTTTILDPGDERTPVARKITPRPESITGNVALLDISKLDAGVVTPTTGPIPVAKLFRRLERELAPLAEAKRLDLRVVHSGAVAASDAALLETILRNLLSNAIKYTETGRVLIGCRRHGDGLRIIVTDTGIGIAPAQQQAIFEPFHQIDNVARDRSMGLGLGLAIVARVAQLLGHEIGLSSAPSRGARFWIDVPRAAATDRADRCRVDIAAGARIAGVA